ncbi:hypothetical protein HPB51_006935 [Rhipicephalus microplus]|uniref:Uncharacterized protein n=1 Tax=Rhipicephalus microplus TaxID=6941 RepID=A0A9J6DSV5_RHIMP|nr:hypothetical protein HPB51_006935 [Rhipicephalus microplus]
MVVSSVGTRRVAPRAARRGPSWCLNYRSAVFFDHAQKVLQDPFESFGQDTHSTTFCLAGVMLMPYLETEDGFELHVSINYLGHCLLTALLLPLLIAASSKGQAARIVNVSSCVHKAGRMDIDDLNSRKSYSCYNGYAQSKLAQVLFTKALGRHLKAKGVPVTVNCIHPGIVNTQLYQRVWWAPLVAGLFFRTPEECVRTVLHATLSSELEGISGHYLEECALAQSLSLCDDHSVQERLWNKTWMLLRPWLNDRTHALDILLAS